MNNEFNLERTIAGEPIETVEGKPAKFIAYLPTARECKQLVIQAETDVRMYYANGKYHGIGENWSYDLRMKSAPTKQIDWSKIPVDTILTLDLCTGETNRYFHSFVDGLVRYCRGGMSSKTIMYKSDMLYIYPSNVKIKHNQPWTIWLGGKCPIPDGLEFEYITHSYPGETRVSEKSPGDYCWLLNAIYAYRLTGKVLDGYSL
jgi:hypothetical protein